MSAVERVRETARLMHERAKAATPGRWWVGAFDRQVLGSLAIQVADPLGDEANAAHIASLDPEVARRIADLLDVCLDSTCAFGDPADDDITVWSRPIPKAARALADAYLGDAS